MVGIDFSLFLHFFFSFFGLSGAYLEDQLPDDCLLLSPSPFQALLFYHKQVFGIFFRVFVKVQTKATVPHSKPDIFMNTKCDSFFCPPFWTGHQILLLLMMMSLIISKSHVSPSQHSNGFVRITFSMSFSLFLFFVSPFAFLWHLSVCLLLLPLVFVCTDNFNLFAFNFTSVFFLYSVFYFR